MVELEMRDRRCCAPETERTCCEPAEKQGCCGSGQEARCSCQAGATAGPRGGERGPIESA